jgi:uncharacterized membrane protein YfcA
MNAIAVLIFIVKTHVEWLLVLYVALAAIAGGQLGVFMLRRINETLLRIAITAIGLGLTIALFLKL